jgi:hypothetical protein
MGYINGELNNNSNHKLNNQSRDQSLPNKTPKVNSGEILDWLENVEKVNSEELSECREEQELVDKLILVYKRPKEWQQLKDNQFKIQDFFKLEKYKISLLLNYAKDIQYLHSLEGLNYSVETILKLESEQNLLILLKHAEKMSLLRSIHWTSKTKNLFEFDGKTLDTLLSLEGKTFRLLGKGDSVERLTAKNISTNNNPDNDQEITRILSDEKDSVIDIIQGQGFGFEDLRSMTPNRLKLLLEFVDQIHYLKKLGYANHTIMNEPDEGMIRLLLTKGEEAMEIAYYYPLTQSLIRNLGEERLTLLLNNIEGAKVLFEYGFFKEEILQEVSTEKLAILLENYKEIKDLVKAGFRIEIMLNPETSLARLNTLVSYKAEVSYLLGLKVSFEGSVTEAAIKDEDLSNLSLNPRRLGLIFREPKIIESYIKLKPKYIIDGIFKGLIDDSTVELLLDAENHKKIIDMVQSGFKFEDIISEGNRESTTIMLRHYDGVITLMSARNRFTVELIERARREKKLGLLLENIETVIYLREQGFSAEGIILMKVEVLNTILPRLSGLKELLSCGYEKEYFINQEINVKLLELLLGNTGTLVRFQAKINWPGLTLFSQKCPYFYENMVWLFGNAHLITEDNRNILNMLKEGHDNLKTSESFNLESVIGTLCSRLAEGDKEIAINMIALLESQGFRLQAFHVAQQSNELLLILNNVSQVLYLREKGFSPKEIVELKEEVLILMLDYIEAVDELMECGFKKEYFINQRINVELLELLLANTATLNRFQKEKNWVGLMYLHENHEYFYENMSWLFENGHLITEGNRNILNMLSQGSDVPTVATANKIFNMPTVIGSKCNGLTEEAKKITIDHFALLESKGYGLEGCHLAKEYKKLSLLLSYVEGANNLVDQGFDPKGVVHVKKEILELLLQNIEGVRVLMDYGFGREYFTDDKTRADILEFVFKHIGGIRLFNGEDYQGNNPYHIRVNGLVELVNLYKHDLEKERQSSFDEIKEFIGKSKQIIDKIRNSNLREIEVTSENISKILLMMRGEEEITERGTVKLSAERVKKKQSTKSTARLTVGGAVGAVVGGIGGLALWGVSKLVFDDAPVSAGTAMKIGGGTGVVATAAVYSTNERRRHGLERRVVESNLDRAFIQLFRKNEDNQIVFREEFQPIKTFFKEIMVTSLADVVENFTKLGGSRSLTIEVLTTIIDNNDPESQDWQTLKTKVNKLQFVNPQNAQNGENPREAVIKLSQGLQKARIILERDGKLENLQGANLLLRLDGSSKQFIRRFGLALLGRNHDFARRQVEEVQSEDLASLEVPRIREAMDRISDRVEWDMR